MILESIIKTFELKQKTLPLIVAGTISALGCANGVTEENPGENSYTYNQGGNAGTSQQGGAAGFDHIDIGGTTSSEDQCVPNTYIICHDGNVYWEDSCGKLGEINVLCSDNKICDNGQCVPDCSMVTPTSGCQEQTCSFYDSFKEDTCKWYVISGAPYVSNDKLQLQGKALLGVKSILNLSSDCYGNFIAQYNVELLNANTPGSLKISHRNADPNFSGLTITHYPSNENNKIILDCNAHEVVAGDFDLHAQKRFKVRKTENQLELYVNDQIATSVTCSNSNNSTPVNAMYVSAGSAVIEQAMKIDDVTIYCTSNVILHYSEAI